MKNILQILLLFMVTLIYAQTPAKAFRFEGNLLDTAGNDPSFGSTGVTYATSTPTRGQALRIDQTGATPVVRARLGSAPGLSTGNVSFSFSFWIFLQPSITAKIIEYGNSTTATGGYNGIQLESSDSGTINANVKLTNGSTVIVDNTDSDVAHYNKWRFYTVIYNSSTSLFSLYIDGALKDSQTVSGGININSNSWTAGDNNAVNKFNLDDFEIFNTALTAAQALTKFKDAIMPVVPTPQSFCSPVLYTSVDVQKYTGAPLGIYSSLIDTTSENLNANAVSGNYFASITVAGVESTRVPFTLNVIQPTTPTPVGTYIQTKGQGARLSNLDITGTDLKFYRSAADALNQTNQVNSSTLLNLNPTIYFVTQQNGLCRSSALIISASHDRITITNAASANVTHRSASITYTINPNSPNVTTPFVSWGLAANALTNTATSSSGFTGFTAQNSSANGIVVRNLQPSTTYYYDLGATNSFYDEPVTGNVQSFTTAAGPAAPLAPATQTICQPANVAALTATGQNLKWYFSSFDPYNGSPSLSMSNPISSNRLMYVTQTVGGIESAATEVSVTVAAGNTPSAPSTPSTYTFCNVAPAQRLLTAVGAIGTNLKWYDSPSATTPVITASATGIYYVTQSTGICESARVAVSITVSDAAASVSSTVGDPFGRRIVNIGYEVLNSVVIPIAAPATLNDLQLTLIGGSAVSGTSLRWVNAANTILIPNSTPIAFTLANGSNLGSAQAVNYQVAFVDGGCISTVRVPVQLSPFYLPRLTPSNVSTCGATTRSIITAFPSNQYHIYTVANGGTPLLDNAVMTAGQYFVEEYNTTLDLVGTRVAFSLVANSSTTTWNGTAWSNGNPDSSKAVIFASGTFNHTTGSLNACSVTVNAGATVNISSVNGLIVTNSITVNNGGTLNFSNGANLVQQSLVPNSGVISQTVNTTMKRLDNTYWSSPVSGQNLQAFSPNTLANRFYRLNEPTNAFVSATPATNSFVAGIGYSVRAPNNFTTTAQIFSGVFTGTPNNGDFVVPISTSLPNATRGYNLIGNPYPSVINANPLLTAQSGTLYFWTKSVRAAGVGNYATYTLAGGVASTLGGTVPQAFIAIGQGFLFKPTDVSATSITFRNSWRSNGSSAVFFKVANRSTANTIRLNLTGDEVFSQVLIAYNDSTINGIDPGYDGLQINENNTLSTIIDTENYAVQSRAAFTDTDVVPMNINLEKAGSYNLSIDKVEGIFNAQQNVFVKDNVTGITHNLSQASYPFVSTEGSFPNRFELVYMGTLTTSDFTANATNVIVYKSNEVLNIKSTFEIATVKIYDMNGRQIFANDNLNSQSFTLSELKAQNQVLLVQITDSQKNIVTTKVIF